METLVNTELLIQDFICSWLLADHPALKASSPQAPISDVWYDDFHHNGAFMMGYFRTFPVFGVQKTKAENAAWYILK
jgi:predicted acyl esterase